MLFADNESVRARIMLSEHRQRRGFGIQLGIAYRRPAFALNPGDESPYSDAISINLTPSGLKFDGETLELTWADSDVESAWIALRELGLPWLRDHAEVGQLIEFLERGVKNGIPCSGPRSVRDSILQRLMNRTSHEPSVRRPPAFFHALACLYYQKGDEPNALKWMKAWIDFHASNPRNVQGFLDEVGKIAHRLTGAAKPSV